MPITVSLSGLPLRACGQHDKASVRDHRCTYRRFKFEILRIIARNDLPGFSLHVRSESGGEPLVQMVKREHGDEQNVQAWAPSRQPPARQRSVLPAAPVPAENLPLLRPLIRTLSDRAIAQIRSEFPGWDIYALQDAYNDWLDQDASRAPKNYEAYSTTAAWKSVASYMEP